MPIVHLDKLVGKKPTRSLFSESVKYSYEQCEAPLTFAKEDVLNEDGSIKQYSIYKIYMEEKDPTEYKVAMRVFGEWNHWLRLRENPIIAENLDRLKAELEAKMRSEVLQKVYETAMEGGVKAFNAAKYIAEQGWVKKVGRPTKRAIAKEARRVTKQITDVDEDLKRIGHIEH